MCPWIKLTNLPTEWKDDTDKAESESYVSDPEPHTLLPILADLCVEDDKNRFARFYKCSLTAIYFPAGTSTEDLKAKVQTRAKKLIDTIQPHAGMPPPVGSVTSAWSTKPYEMNEQAMDTLLICTCTPSNKKTDEQVQLERQAWNDFLEDIKSFGYTSTDERHGFLQEYRNHSKYVFEEDTDEDDDEIDANLDHTSGAVARLRTLAEKMGGEVGQDDIIERINRMTTCCCGIDDHIPMSKARLDRIR